MWRRGRLAKVELTENGLEGTLPPQLSVLKECRVIALFGNNLTGTLQNLELSRTLTHLDLSRNKLEGTIPPSLLCSLPKLRRLHLEANKFSGELPSQLSTLSDMEEFTAQNNLVSARPARVASLFTEAGEAVRGAFRACCFEGTFERSGDLTGPSPGPLPSAGEGVATFGAASGAADGRTRAVRALGPHAAAEGPFQAALSSRVRLRALFHRPARRHRRGAVSRALLSGPARLWTVEGSLFLPTSRRRGRGPLQGPFEGTASRGFLRGRFKWPVSGLLKGPSPGPHPSAGFGGAAFGGSAPPPSVRGPCVYARSMQRSSRARSRPRSQVSAGSACSDCTETRESLGRSTFRALSTSLGRQISPTQVTCVHHNLQNSRRRPSRADESRPRCPRRG